MPPSWRARAGSPGERSRQSGSLACGRRPICWQLGGVLRLGESTSTGCAREAPTCRHPRRAASPSNSRLPKGTLHGNHGPPAALQPCARPRPAGACPIRGRPISTHGATTGRPARGTRQPGGTRCPRAADRPRGGLVAGWGAATAALHVHPGLRQHGPQTRGGRSTGIPCRPDPPGRSPGSSPSRPWQRCLRGGSTRHRFRAARPQERAGGADRLDGLGGGGVGLRRRPRRDPHRLGLLSQ